MLEHVTDLLDVPYLTDVSLLGNTAAQWLAAAIIALVVFLLLAFGLMFLVSRLRKITVRTATTIDDIVVRVVSGTGRIFMATVAIWVGAQVLTVSARVDHVLDAALVILLIIQLARWANAAVGLWLEQEREKRAEEEPAAVTTLQALSYVVRLVIWSASLLFILDNLGFDVTALVAGLGIGGVAVALAVQNILGDLFASLSIVLDKPFVIGDFIIVDAYLGTVEKIGLKTTRVRSLGGEQLIFSNADLLSSRVRNYKRMAERRVLFSVGVTYQTSAAHLEELPVLIREIVEGIDQTRFDRSHFKEFGDSAYIFETVYWILAPDYNLFMDIQQVVNLGIVRAFEERGIVVTYPTRTLWVEEGSRLAVEKVESRLVAGNDEDLR